MNPPVMNQSNYPQPNFNKAVFDKYAHYHPSGPTTMNTNHNPVIHSNMVPVPPIENKPVMVKTTFPTGNPPVRTTNSHQTTNIETAYQSYSYTPNLNGPHQIS